ncbi:ABC transporter permease subunit [Arthrobacter sp. MYb227]|uniref:ABC transporter permease subunit n=1 Tax=Arthrobacter sp. MYb227 TaxID=1848601 RepID=UPI0015E284DC|nr:ABC transporter permease subunit [Arthrobacter sp. MYb227]
MFFEATKLWAVRSTRITLASALIAHIGLSWLLAFSAKASGDNGYESFMPAPYMSLASLQLAQLFVAALAALSITSEYSNGTIFSSLQAVPLRARLLGAKAAVIGILGFVFGLLLIGAGTLLAAPAAGHYGAFGADELLIALFGGGFYLGALSMMMLGVGVLLRSTAGAITSAFVLIFGLPQILPLFNIQWLQDLAFYLPTNAGQILGTGQTEPYGATVAVLVLVLWTLVLLGSGIWVFKRRDA